MYLKAFFFSFRMVEEETFIMVSLEEQKSKELAQVISNDTSRKILASLGKKESTETELSKQLNIPLSTVHYNMKQLTKTGLVQAKEFVYSEKGKEVNIYSIVKKLIVIAPSGNDFKSSLKTLLSISLISLGAAFIIQLTSNFFIKQPTIEAAKVGISQGAEISSLSNNINSTVQNIVMPNYGVWFFLGAIFAVLLFLFFMVLRKK